MSILMVVTAGWLTNAQSQTVAGAGGSTRRTAIPLSTGALCAAALACGSASAQKIIPFTEEAVQRGLIYEVQPWNGPTEQFQGFGVAIVDLENNGHQDIIVMGNGTGRVGFFENDGTGHFIDRSFTPGGQPKFLVPKASGIAVADLNANGLLDVYITQQFYYPNLLLRNDGDFNFTSIAFSAGVANTGFGEGAAWADYDNDGWLDLYVVNWTLPSQMENPLRRNQLYRNLGNETFASMAIELGVDDVGVGYSVVFSDINRNGWLDLYVANDRGHMPPLFHANQLWVNNGGTFENICETSGACLGLWAMCAAAGDFNGNGYADFYVTNLSNPGGYNGWNPLLVNQGDETFVEACVDAGVCQFISSWASIFFDYNNNGWLDLYVANQGQPNNLFANAGAFPVENVAQLAGVGGSMGGSFNAAVGDVTGNGAIDLLLNNYGSNGNPANVQLFINHEALQRKWIRFNVVGLHQNRNAIGANIEITTGDHVQWREIYAGGNNFKSQNELVFHFGIGLAETVDQIVVNWPGGTTSRPLSNYPANQTWTIYPDEMLGDYTGDGQIGVLDLLGLLSAWGQVQPGKEMLDMNGDGVVNIFDLLELLSRWGALN